MVNRVQLNSLHPDDKKELVNLLLECITDELVREHAKAPFQEWHGPPRTIFFERHKEYVKKMEKLISEKSGQKFIPLPYWDGTTEIPLEFMAVADIHPDDGTLVEPPQDPGPFIDVIPPQWIPPLICNIPSTEGSTVFMSIMDLHGFTHGLIGGIMQGLWSPAAPIFWCFHAFFVELYDNWQDCRN